MRFLKKTLVHRLKKKKSFKKPKTNKQNINLHHNYQKSILFHCPTNSQNAVNSPGNNVGSNHLCVCGDKTIAYLRQLGFFRLCLFVDWLDKNH